MKNNSRRTITDIKDMLQTSCQMFQSKAAFKIKGEVITYEALYEDVNGLGTFLLWNGLKGKNIAIMGESSYEWATAYLSVVCGIGAAVPLGKEWELHKLKRYINATDCSCIIFSESFKDIVWNLYNDGVTPLQTFICMEQVPKEYPFTPMEEAISQGKACIAAGYARFFEEQVAQDDLAVIQFESEDLDCPKPVTLTHGAMAERLVSLADTAHTNRLESIEGLLLPLYQGQTIAFHKSNE